MSILLFAGDALWVLALSIMSAATLRAWRRMTPDTRVPMQFRADGSPIFRARRNGALATPIVVALFLGLLLVAYNRNTAAAAGEQAVILFGARATLAALCALADLRWLKAAMDVLEQEGALKP